VKIRFVLLIAFGLILAGCSPKMDLVNDEFPKEQEEIKKTFGEIAQSIKDGDLDKLISFHAYGPKFTEFKDGKPRNGGGENEKHERTVFGSVTEVVKLDAKDMNIAVYGDVANVTFHSDFHLKFGEDLVVVNNQISLLFVKSNDEWKIVHEHHSPLNK
jgi:ketosteroid isomerase-like protein